MIHRSQCCMYNIINSPDRQKTGFFIFDCCSKKNIPKWTHTHSTESIQFENEWKQTKKNEDVTINTHTCSVFEGEMRLNVYFHFIIILGSGMCSTKKWSIVHVELRNRTEDRIKPFNRITNSNSNSFNTNTLSTFTRHTVYVM